MCPETFVSFKESLLKSKTDVSKMKHSLPINFTRLFSACSEMNTFAYVLIFLSFYNADIKLKHQPGVHS